MRIIKHLQVDKIGFIRISASLGRDCREQWDVAFELEAPAHALGIERAFDVLFVHLEHER